jgi:hypothetical protein
MNQQQVSEKMAPALLHQAALVADVALISALGLTSTKRFRF